MTDLGSKERVIRSFNPRIRHKKVTERIEVSAPRKVPIRIAVKFCFRILRWFTIGMASTHVAGVSIIAIALVPSLNWA